MSIRLFKPNVRATSISAVADVLRSGWIGMGPKTQEFEKSFASYVGAQRCVAVNSCTAALHLSLRVLDLPEGAEVITMANTFVSTNHVILYERLKPVFADINPRTGNLDPASVESKINPNTGAIIVMHYGGYPCDLDEFYALGKRYNIPIIEDCAHACGSTYHGRPIGSNESLQAFSFDPTKNLTSGEGGAITCALAEQEVRLRRLRYLGMDRDSFGRYENRSDAPRSEYDVHELGFRYHMNDMQAAIGLSQMEYIDQDNARRKEIAQKYSSLLADVPGLNMLERLDDRESSNFLFCVLADNRNALAAKLAENGVATAVHFRRNDTYSMYEEAYLPSTEYFCSHALSLPMHTLLTDDEVEFICKIIREGWL